MLTRRLTCVVSDVKSQRYSGDGYDNGTDQEGSVGVCVCIDHACVTEKGGNRSLSRTGTEERERASHKYELREK